MRLDGLTEAETLLGHELRVVVDRPLGSRHPRLDIVYPVNYGYVPGTRAADGREVDAYVLGVGEPAQSFRGRCIALVHRFDDAEDKLVVVPEGYDPSDEEILRATHFQERFFRVQIVRPDACRLF